MDKERFADILVDSQCYVNTIRSNENPILLPDGSALPVYLSCRRLFSRVKGRKEVESALAEQVRRNFPKTDLIIGLSTAGIGWGYAVAAQLDLPFAYVRSSTKGYGLGGLVEGNPIVGSKAVIIDDVLNTGKSLFTAVDALRDEMNIQTIGVATIITLNGGGVKEYKERGITATALTDYRSLVDSALNKDVISDDECHKMVEIYTATKVLYR